MLASFQISTSLGLGYRSGYRVFEQKRFHIFFESLLQPNQVIKLFSKLD